MKILTKTGFTFTPAQRLIDFSATANFDVRGLFGIINVAAGAPIYVAGGGQLGAASINGAKVTLAADTTAMLSSDPLLVLYDDGTAPANAPAQAAANVLLQSILAAFPALVNGRFPVDPSGVTSPVSAASLPLPTGAATAAKQDAASATLASILNALQAQIDLETSIWTDGTAFYVRRESVNEGTGAVTVTYTDPTGAVVTPPSGIRPVASDNAISLLTTYYDVLTGGTGTSVGDVVARIVAVNKAVTPPTASSAIWLDMTTGAVIAAPAAGSIAEQTQKVAMTSKQLPAALGSQAAAASLAVTLATDGVFVQNLGAPGDTAFTGSGSSSLIGIAKALYGQLAGNLKAGALMQYSAALPSLTSGGLGYAQVDQNGRQLIGSIAAALPAGGNVIGGVTQSGSWSMSVTGTATVTGTVTLGAGTAAIGSVTLGAGSATIGNVGLVAGSATIGSVNVLGGNTASPVSTADVVPAAVDNSYGPATSATNALAANPKRTGVYVRNDNSFTVYINFRAAASTTVPAAGNIPLAANGGEWRSQIGMCPKTAMSIIAGTAGGVVTIMEGTSP